ncbi:MAG: FKBP-type peptidyl-prolyl cis-trans isomerase N-terminal domain-containing protein, partial [Bacteroidota bacterium]
MGVADKLFQLKSEKAEANLKAGNEFLEKNKSRAEVVALASGLQYEIMQQGTGEKPKA